MTAVQSTYNFWLYRSKINSRGESPIFMRIKVSSTKCELSTGIWILKRNWDSKHQRVKGAGNDTIYINDHLADLIQKYYGALNEINRGTDEFFDALNVKRKILGEDAPSRGLTELIAYHNKQALKLVGKDYAPLTYGKYLTCEKLVKEYLKLHKVADIPLCNISHKFLAEFQTFLKVEKNHKHNTTVKYIKNLKAIAAKGVIWGWCEKNPFTGFKANEKIIFKDFLTQEELGSIEQKEFTIDRLENVKRVFLFQCYTGLAYSDMSSLVPDDIREYKSLKWVWKDRDKTGVPIRVPLLDKALAILNLTTMGEKLFSLSSNQKMNAYLKEIADTCGITKNLTTHCARRTFATLSLSNGMSLESVSRMLGHANTTITQKHYARVLPERILAEIKANNSLPNFSL